MDQGGNAATGNHAATRLAWSLWAACVALIGLALLLDFLTGEVVFPLELRGLRPGFAFTVPTGVLSLAYVGLVVSLQYVFRALTGGDSQLVIVVSTLVIAALFNPLRRRIQSFIDRRFYRSKCDARKTLEDFGARLRNETVLDSLSEDLVGMVHERVSPAQVSLWLRPSGRTGTNEESRP
jgi:hypothetical protein